uniref:C-type lectin domain-containing protein n=2 Tax=Oryzias melastigma TaxID=30732 RepID=A0A3B3CL03_ORYME
MATNKEKQNLSDLEAKNEQLRELQIQTEDLRMNMTKLENLTEHLTAENMFLENKTKEMKVIMTIQQMQIEQLRNNSDELNRIQAAIISYTNFPGDLFCPVEVCQMCPNDWIEFNKSCYYFYNFNSSLKTWDESRQFCQNNKSDLVVISSQEEQTFIKNRTDYCNDTQYGYWIGLRKISNNWTWVDDTQETLGNWNNEGSPENFTLIIQNATESHSWYKERNSALNRFICEIKALIF